MKDSFLNKLKKGMDLADEEEETTNQPRARMVPNRGQIKEIPIEIEGEEKEKQKEPPKVEEPPKKSELKKTQPEKIKVKKKGKEEWPEAEGQLAVDVYQTDSKLVIHSAIAGVDPKDLDITIEGDLLTIKGKRKNPSDEKGDYFYQECYWGEFSRQIILPVEVDPGRIEATLKEGILIIQIPKIVREGKMKVEVEKI